MISTSEVQVYLFASILYGLMEVASNLLPNSSAKTTVPNKPLHDIPPPVLTKGKFNMVKTSKTPFSLDLTVVISKKKIF